MSISRRKFVATTALSAGALVVPWGCATPETADSKDGSVSKHKNWIWIGPRPEKSLDDWRSDFTLYKSKGIHAVLLEVFNGSTAFYESDFLPSRGRMLETAIEAAQEVGLELHAWMWSMPCLIPEIIEEHPEWYNVNAKGESSATDPAYVDYYKFLCPRRPETREFLRKRVAELASKEGLAGVHLDYIRHPDAILPVGLWSKYDLVQDKVYPEFDYCYCDHCRNEYKAEHGIDPMDLEDPTSEPSWMQFRWDSVTELVNTILIPEAKGRDKMITAAVFPGPSMARNMVRQNWGDWNLDAYLPMLYHSFYNETPDWVGKMSEEGIEAAAPGKLYSGLFVPGIKSKEEFEATLRSAYDAGAAGVSLFGMREEYWDVFEKVASE